MIELILLGEIVIAALLAVGAFTLSAAKKAAEASATELGKAAARALDWPNELSRVLEETRGVERQELRYKSYGLLWAKLRPLAIYDESTFDKGAARKLLASLSDWYFSEHGGLLLTPQARDFYFALQNLLQIVIQQDDWLATRSTDATPDSEGMALESLVSKLLPDTSQDLLDVLRYFESGDFEDWQAKSPAYGKQWKNGLQRIAQVWNEIEEPYEKFLVLQQTASKLRSTLSIDLESRLH